MASIKNLGFLAQLRSEASNHVIRYRNGKIRQSGRGLVFWFLPQAASIAELPMDDREMALFVKGRSQDFQAVAIQGTLTWHVVDPELLAARVDFSLGLLTGSYKSEPIQRIETRLAGLVNQAALQYLAQSPVRALLDAGPEPLRHQLEAALEADPALGEIGIGVTAISGWNNSVAQIGAEWMAHGMAEAARERGAARDFVFARSAEMRNRAREFDAGIADAFKQMRGERTSIQTMQAMAMWGIGTIDVNLVAVPTWLGAYHKGLSEGMSEQDAASYGDKAVRLSQGSGRAKDLAAVQGAGEGIRMATMFYSYFNVLYNKQYETVRDMKRGDYRKAANTTFWVMIAGPLMAAALTGDWPVDDEDWGEWAARKVFFGLWAGVPLVRDLSSYIERKVSGQYGSLPSLPVWRAGDAVVKVGTDAVRAAKGDEVSDRWLEHAIEAPGYFLGLPTSGPQPTIKYAYGVATGSQHPNSPADVAKGVLKGPQKDQE